MKQAKEVKTSVSYECRFDDGEYIASFKTEREAMDYRAENNFNYISRSIHVYKSILHQYDDGYGYYENKKIV